MHSENEIRRAIRPLLELYGELNTSQIKEKLEEVLDFDDEDKILSDTRKEIKIIQRIGNIVSHQIQVVKTYSEGFIVDKTETPAKWYATSGLSSDIDKVSNDIMERKKRVAKKMSTTHNFRKINWQLENERRTNIGLLGEIFVLEQEKDYVRSFDENAVDRIIHLSAKQGDGFGYDILSLNDQGETVYIEVKTTTLEENTPFYMSKNEKLFFENNIDNNAYLYRVYNFNIDSRHGIIKKLSARDLIENYNFDPVSFMVTKK